MEKIIKNNTRHADAESSSALSASPVNMGWRIKSAMTHRCLIGTLAYLLISTLTISCSDYLDVVPDSVFQYEDLYTSRNSARQALAQCYWYAYQHGSMHVCMEYYGDNYTPISPSAVANKHTIITILIFIRTYQEDRMLKKELEGYREYSCKVKYRFIPYIW